jgi:hypothetical protein
MRLNKVRTGHRLPQKFMMLMIRLVSRDPDQPQDGIRTVLYRPKFFGKPFQDLMHEAMYRPTYWARGECSLFGAFTSLKMGCRY